LFIILKRLALILHVVKEGLVLPENKNLKLKNIKLKILKILKI
jgi:hypothetical protein